MGEDRTIAEVARRFHTSAQAVHGWQAAFQWQKRLSEREKLVAGLVAQKANEDEAQSRADFLKLNRATMIRYAEALQANRIAMSPADLDRMARLDQFLRGKASDRSELMIGGPAFDKLIDAMIEVIERNVADPELRQRLALGFQEAAAGLGHA